MLMECRMWYEDIKDTYLTISKWTWHLEKLVSISDRTSVRLDINYFKIIIPLVDEKKYIDNF